VTDAELVSRVLAGSEEAARRLVEQHQQSVFNLIFRMVRDQGIAEELAQDSFAKAFAALRSYDPRYRLVSWLLRISQNTAIDYLRRTRRETVSLDDNEAGKLPESVLEDARQPSPEMEAQRTDLARALSRALDHLRPEYRRLVVLRYQEDQSYEEIAALLGLPLGTVKSHLHRARQEMARLMAAAGWGPGAAARGSVGATRQDAGT
jgi:RNA polymerase sigma factor (sigma-70 family)